jgi:hypothetical protein
MRSSRGSSAGRPSRARSSSRPAGDEPISERVLQEGFGRRVVLEDGRGSVRKTFHDGPVELRRAQAHVEFARLRGFATALEGVPGVACPQPLELLADPPGLRMEHAPGTNLLDLLAGMRLDAGARARLAGLMAVAIGAYVRALGEPLPDFKLDNLLYEPAAGGLTFVDLGAPQDAVPAAEGLSDYEVTVGDMLGSVVFQSARPRHVLRRRQHAESVALAVAVIDALRGGGAGPLRDAELHRAGRAAYRRCAFGRSARRSAWYATAGYLLARRVPLGRRRLGPLAPWRVLR